jgi:hypothetical protein
MASTPSAPARNLTSPFDDDGDAKGIPLPTLHDDAERDKKGAAALVSLKMDASADLATAPKDGLYANFFGHLTTLDRIDMTSWEGDKWFIEAEMGGDVALGPTRIWFTEADIGLRKFGRTLAQGQCPIAMPRNPKKWPLKDTDEAIGRTVPCAYNVEMTRFQPGTSDAPGRCSGRLSLFYDYETKPLWVTGTFKNIRCARGKVTTVTVEGDGGKSTTPASSTGGYSK